MRKAFAVLIVIVVIAVGGYTFVQNRSTGGKDSNANSQPDGFNKQTHSTDNADSLWIVVNKRRPLEPKQFTPQSLVNPDIPLRLDDSAHEMLLRKDAADALTAMNRGAHKAGHGLMLTSGFRPYSAQNTLYSYYVDTQGQAVADTQSARPSFSEHQTGLAADIVGMTRTCEVMECFAETPEGKWVAEHAHEYGFIVRYPKDKQQVTGYIYEPWHLRYVGRELAAELHKQGNPTLEEFFGLGAAPDYK